MLQQDEPRDFVIATGETHTVREFLDLAFEIAGLESSSNYVEIDSRFFRPHEVPLLLGDASKAKNKLGWTPKTDFKQLTRMMFFADLKEVQRQENIKIRL